MLYTRRTRDEPAGSTDWKLRLGTVVMFTVIFATVIGLLTNARRAEIFGSTAAYATVLVSENLGS